MRIERENYRKSFYLFNWLCKYLFFLTLFISVNISCQTILKKKIAIPDDLSDYREGTFSGTVFISQKENQNHFNADIVISKENKLRMDLSVFPEISVFTLLLNEKDITFLLPQKKEFYKGNEEQGMLSTFFPKNLKVSVFKEIFFDRKPREKHWICKVNKQNLPVECQNASWIIKWERGGQRSLLLKSEGFNFTFRSSAFSSKVNEDLFNIKIPENFQKILLLK